MVVDLMQLQLCRLSLQSLAYLYWGTTITVPLQ